MIYRLTTQLPTDTRKLARAHLTTPFLEFCIEKKVNERKQ